MSRNIYDAIDTDNEGFLFTNQVEVFVKDFLRGNQVEGQTNTSFDSQHDHIFSMLNDIESGEMTFEELSKFLNELLKN